ncbi:succinate dehydrogenase, hydrophobic membrane anchor protein [Massilia oculi]|jgi:succinate dehydrogenase / fumarate reductase membrane anchor subunit|uniref:Succinate dehydrogenase hydrophobic membrane anchor subunit n=3 Tax=Massilia TaxID=149698 RepID=A0A422QKL6_9BURK|nr:MULTISPECIES: succinate dehydrogenase, hydrophobic membrane anchor protein [Massilia]AWL06617.1 succinate dehydrogenase, hydrophobic membrane anchor protein [Massilia oculi]MDY0963660.1 succinate dehydrogenase, hydrophobic membrane anchor protein [Massilia sp. CFBP9026]MDY0978166.1 succinate dehydrogenase, hydrophobic membrane anchor protein [Massilia sp. CFBP9012]RNF30452.1 succinate dehydrogenase [Massilia aurea]TXG02200.1 succinate dehydrogenase, hydrophobic membrane anchor protein [Mass
MATKNNIGPRRMVVGAHYGFRDWLAQRVTAIVMAIYTVVLLVSFLTGQNFTYEGWAGLFAQQWFKLFSLVTFLALYYHAWVGIRDIWMDYVKNAGLRLLLQLATIFWLIACAAWTVQILWSV